MIENQDRSYYIGASDSSMVLTKNRNTKSFRKWWAVKMGEQEPDFKGSMYTEAGNRYEHPILKAISEDIRLDHQIIIDKLRLRVNYDGDLDGIIYEVKTHKAEKPFELYTSYWRQAQVEMYAYQQRCDDFKKLYVVSYALYPDEYFAEKELHVDINRVRFEEVKYDKRFIKDEYLPNLKELARCLKKGKIPH